MNYLKNNNILFNQFLICSWTSIFTYSRLHVLFQYHCKKKKPALYIVIKQKYNLAQIN